jgi:hypothetical protein
MNNMKKQNKLNWYNVSLNQFILLQDALKIEDDTEKMISVAEIILGNDVTNLPLKEFNEQMKQLDFLKEEIPTSVPPKKLEINGKKYFMDCLLGNITTAQYVDFSNHSNTGDFAKMLSVFIIPEGHTYNDGYDMLEVINDIGTLPIPIANSTAFFFGRQFSTFMRIFQRYSAKQIKKTNLPKEVKENLIKVMENSVKLIATPLE